MTQKVRKFALTAEELEDIAPTLSVVLPHPLNILFDDVTGTLEGGDQEVYSAVGFGIGISKTMAGDWETTEYNRALIAWIIARHTTDSFEKPRLRHISSVVEAILRLAASTPAARHEAARILTAALTDWATATFER